MLVSWIQGTWSCVTLKTASKTALLLESLLPKLGSAGIWFSCMLVGNERRKRGKKIGKEGAKGEEKEGKQTAVMGFVSL